MLCRDPEEDHAEAEDQEVALAADRAEASVEALEADLAADTEADLEVGLTTIIITADGITVRITDTIIMAEAVASAECLRCLSSQFS